MGVFIEIAVQQEGLSSALSQQIAGVCPVDIFAVEDARLVVKPEEEDECTLCELCLKAAPAGAIRIHKTFSGETLISSGDSRDGSSASDDAADR
jgi:NAD-dependent dihydropyrimidine dehydrogenase PreA subunit